MLGYGEGQGNGREYGAEVVGVVGGEDDCKEGWLLVMVVVKMVVMRVGCL